MISHNNAISILEDHRGANKFVNTSNVDCAFQVCGISNLSMHSCTLDASLRLSCVTKKGSGTNIFAYLVVNDDNGEE